MQSRYPFVLPRGYVGADGTVHREGVMRLATARDELEPLRDPLVTGPDDPRLTILVLARVVERLGTIDYVTSNEIEGLFAADLAFLQDFYGVINFGDQEEYEALLRAQAATAPPPHPVDPASLGAAGRTTGTGSDATATAESSEPAPSGDEAAPAATPSSRRTAIEEVASARS